MSTKNQQNSSQNKENNWLFEEHEWSSLTKEKRDKQDLEEYQKRISGFLKYQSYKTRYRVNKRLRLHKLKDLLDFNKLWAGIQLLVSKIRSDKRYVIGTISFLALIFLTIPLRPGNNQTTESGSQEESLVLSHTTEKVDPTFEVVIPEKTQTVEKDKVLFDAEKQVASYQDAIGGITVTVSQFPVPEGFENNPQDELKKIADNISANTVISDSEPRAYLGSSHKGPQIVVFYKDGLLIFIQSSAEVKLLAWNEYIKTLY